MLRRGAIAGAEIHEFGWKRDDWDSLAAGVVGGHVIECGAQATGGNCQVDWETMPDLAGIGYPILEAEARRALRDHQAPGHGRASDGGGRDRTVSV